jgi:hypothetical protein
MIRWTGQAARMGEIKKCIQNFGVKKVKGTDYPKDLGTKGRTILERTAGK